MDLLRRRAGGSPRSRRAAGVAGKMRITRRQPEPAGQHHNPRVGGSSPSFRHLRKPRSGGVFFCSDAAQAARNPRVGNGMGNTPRRGGQSSELGGGRRHPPSRERTCHQFGRRVLLCMERSPSGATTPGGGACARASSALASLTARWGRLVRGGPGMQAVGREEAVDELDRNRPFSDRGGHALY